MAAKQPEFGMRHVTVVPTALRTAEDDDGRRTDDADEPADAH
ncbi:hypothetical protein [Halobacterium yunchengense]